MKLSDLSESEQKLWQAAATGTVVDLRVGDSKLDAPERWATWGPERSVRAEVITALLLGEGEATTVAVRGVRLQGARITGELNLEACTLRGPLALLGCSFAEAINLDKATAPSVRLTGTHIPALHARQLLTRGDLRLNDGFRVSGGVRAEQAHIGGVLDCTGGQFSNPDGAALFADGLTVDGDMYCREGFSASGEVVLLGAHIGGDLDCMRGQFSNPNGVALALEDATVAGPLLMQSAVLEGIFNLIAATTRGYYDNRASWPLKLRLDGFVYKAIEGASAHERLEWLRRNEEGYSPQIYEQLAAVYRRHGHDEAVRCVLIAKQRQRSAQGHLGAKLWGYLLDWTVGYGYRTWLAGFWLVGLLALGTYLFGNVYRAELTPASKTTAPSSFQPFLYTLDLLLPVVSLHVHDAWVAQGAAQWWSVIFIVLGWVLATAVVLSLTGLLKRDS